MKRLIWLPVAGFLLIAGAAVAAAAPGIVDSATSLVNAQDDDPDTDDSGLVLHVPGTDSLLQEVLADLVTQGVITEEQSGAITGALATRVEERRAELEAQREQMREMWTQIRGFLEDGVISADEIAQLPADNPFSKLQGILDDGQVTLEELQSLRPFGGPGFGEPGHGRGHGAHGGMWGPGFAPDLPADDGSDTDSSASPSAS